MDLDAGVETEVVPGTPDGAEYKTHGFGLYDPGRSILLSYRIELD